MNFEFATAGRIIFGSGTAQQIAPLAAKMGTRALVVTDARVEGAQAIIEQLNQHGLECLTFEVDCEPTTDLIKSGAGQARQAQHNLVIGIGGGSVLDTGKAIAAMLTNKGELEDYLEVVGKGQPLTEPPVAYIAVPTTAGTGAEVTRNAVLAVPKHGVKVSMRSPLMLPRVAVVDPVLTYSMPPPVTASTGLDALTQVMEPYVSNKSNPLTDGICREGLTRAARSLKRAYEDGTNAAAREDMSLASLFGGLALANAKLGAVHGFAIHAPHGVICARLLPHVMEVNVRVLQSRTPDSPALARYDQVARLLTGTATAKAPDGVAWVQGLCEVLKVPPLADFGLKQQDFPTAVAKAQKASSMKGNPITLTEAELTEILTKAA
ncbi:MAG: iron-containing alcohol dehydrogenase [Planctomycetota bacterium]|jgi:alcohol dehydrogenase class IV